MSPQLASLPIGGLVTNSNGPTRAQTSLGTASRPEQHLTIDDLYTLPPAVPVAIADAAIGIGATLSKRLRADHEYPLRLLPGRGRHDAVALADILRYLGLPLPGPASTGDFSSMDGTITPTTVEEVAA